MKNFEHLRDTITAASDLEMDFDVITGGTSSKVRFYTETGELDTTQRYMDYLIRNRGMHLANMTLVEVKKRLAAGLYTPINTDPNRHTVRTVAFNPQNIKKNLNKVVYALDIRSCYWNTAHNIGVISDKLYDYGCSKEKEWKSVRNIAIGALGTQIRIEKYRGGKLVEKSPYTPRPTNVCRLDIIDKVWEICMENIREEIGDSFMMFLTDCFFVTSKAANKVKKLLKENGYDVRKERVIFTAMKNISVGTYKVYWQTSMREKFQSFDKSNIK